jgi:hypothetical protein
MQSGSFTADIFPPSDHYITTLPVEETTSAAAGQSLFVHNGRTFIKTGHLITVSSLGLASSIHHDKHTSYYMHTCSILYLS